MTNYIPFQSPFIKPQTLNMRHIQEAAQQVSLHKQSKSTFKQIYGDLGIQQKGKKEDMVKSLPQEILKYIIMDPDHMIFKKYKILQELARRYHELMRPSQLHIQQMQQMFTSQQQLQNMMYVPNVQMYPYQFQMFQYPFGMMNQPPQFKMPFLGGQVPPFQDLSQIFPLHSNQIFHCCPCMSPSFKKPLLMLSGDIKCINCENRLHPQCIGVGENDLLECPQCILVKMDPLHQVVKQFGNSVMSCGSIDGMRVNFILNQEELGLIRQQHFIEVRCIRLEYKSMIEITWPDFGELVINQSRVLDLKPLQANSSVKKRKDEKYTTNDMQILTSSINTVVLKEIYQGLRETKQLKVTPDAIYFMGVFLINKLEPQQLITQLIQDKNNYKPKMDSIKLIRRQCSSQNEMDQDLAISQVSVSLRCSFDSSMIQTPCRGPFCKHIQCFSLENLIKMTSAVSPRKWRCPICKQIAFQMIIDSYFLEILNDYRKRGLIVREVTLDSDGVKIQEQEEQRLLSYSGDESKDIEDQPQKIQDQIILNDSNIHIEINSCNNNNDQNNNNNGNDQNNNNGNNQNNNNNGNNQNNNGNNNNTHNNDYDEVIQIDEENAHISIIEESPKKVLSQIEDKRMSLSTMFSILSQQILQPQILQQQLNKQLLNSQIGNQIDSYKKIMIYQKKEQDRTSPFIPNTIQQVMTVSRLRLRDIIQKNMDSIPGRLKSLPQCIEWVQQPQKVFKIWNQRSDIVDEGEFQQVQEEGSGVATGTIALSNNKQRVLSKQKEKLVKVIKRQFHDYIRKNIIIDNPIPYQQQRSNNQRTSYRLSSIEQMVPEQKKKKILIEQKIYEQEQPEPIHKQQGNHHHPICIDDD